MELGPFVKFGPFQYSELMACSFSLVVNQYTEACVARTAKIKQNKIYKL